ncbi:hypothetical protein [Bovine alphaherpesvirus 5]|nr:hypothetical protein [Bovine alphaherpesvirus 5]QVY10593.1 UL0.7 [Bovine alphaherpesvirus 5]UHJ15485.1 UL0.7 unknown product [Bovine alphaherpesvirus 5]UHJ15558.1 UL0.7 unknown product [Bovine alphaherpesvirus 5]
MPASSRTASSCGGRSASNRSPRHGSARMVSALSTRRAAQARGSHSSAASSAASSAQAQARASAGAMPLGATAGAQRVQPRGLACDVYIRAYHRPRDRGQAVGRFPPPQTGPAQPAGSGWSPHRALRRAAGLAPAQGPGVRPGPSAGSRLGEEGRGPACGAGGARASPRAPAPHTGARSAGRRKVSAQRTGRRAGAPAGLGS